MAHSDAEPPPPPARGSPPAASPAGGDPRRWSYVVLVFLTLGAGAMDGVAFLALGGVFTANMTGNLILVALVGGENWQIRVIRSGLACVIFSIGVFVGFKVPDRGRGNESWPLAVTRLLWICLALHVVFLTGWILCDAAPGPTSTLLLIAVASCAMGLQAAAARRVNVDGITTTFVTGTLTSLLQSLASRRTADALRRAVIVLALAAGALCASLVVHLAPLWAGAVPLLFTILAPVTVVTRLRPRRARRPPTGTAG
ncbi:YoaK family protein [Streptosporangium canum]|uniref:YoaK family protein n=1 Tax=Streptosporangium canum TaxID=324952 RepID=UPI00343AD31C